MVVVVVERTVVVVVGAVVVVVGGRVVVVVGAGTVVVVVVEPTVVVVVRTVVVVVGGRVVVVVGAGTVVVVGPLGAETRRVAGLETAIPLALVKTARYLNPSRPILVLSVSETEVAPATF